MINIITANFYVVVVDIIIFQEEINLFPTIFFIVILNACYFLGARKSMNGRHLQPKISGSLSCNFKPSAWIIFICLFNFYVQTAVKRSFVCACVCIAFNSVIPANCGIFWYHFFKQIFTRYWRHPHHLLLADVKLGIFIRVFSSFIRCCYCSHTQKWRCFGCRLSIWRQPMCWLHEQCIRFIST